MDPFRRILPLLLLLAAATAQQQEPPPAHYTAHEWGTFTSMVGTDGGVLDGLHHEEEALPPFVHDLLKVDSWGTTRDKLPASRVTQKMETPVIYFYSDEPQQVAVRVWFGKGLMTQFYPLPSTIFPELPDARSQRVDMSKVEGSMLTWDIDVIPRSQKAPEGIPKVGAEEPWGFARQTQSCWVRTRPEPGSPAKPEAEHYLFYRGLGRWQPQVTLECSPAGRAVLTNGMAQAIPFAMALELGERGGRFVEGVPVAAGAEAAFALGDAPWCADREQFARRVGASVLRALVQQGLFDDEARAMVATWSRSWFQKDGARIVYVLPREQVDAALPLSFEPRPEHLVRALVGRLEFITPAAQARVERALRDAAGADAATAKAGEAALLGLDRFLEPHLRNVVKNGADPAVQRAAAARLAAASR